MNIALWVVQGLLALSFLIAAGLKLFAFHAMAAKSPGTEGLHGLFIFIALCEIAGAAGLIVPQVTGKVTPLIAWAAAGLATVSLLAFGFHLGRGEFLEMIPAAVLFALCTFVAWGRGFNVSGGTTRGTELKFNPSRTLS